MFIKCESIVRDWVILVKIKANHERCLCTDEQRYKRRNIMYFITGYFLKLSNIHAVNVYIVIHILICKNREKFNNVNVHQKI